MSNDEIIILTNKVDTGFKEMGDRLGALHLEYLTHQTICMKRFAGIDSKFAVLDAVGCIRQQQQREKLDLWKWIGRGTTSIIALGAATLIWKLLIGTAKITIG